MHGWLDQNIKSYLEPWAFGQLNVVEKVLLARAHVAEIEIGPAANARKPRYASTRSEIVSTSCS